jgi:hypothetical protein
VRMVSLTYCFVWKKDPYCLLQVSWNWLGRVCLVMAGSAESCKDRSMCSGSSWACWISAMACVHCCKLERIHNLGASG